MTWPCGSSKDRGSGFGERKRQSGGVRQGECEAHVEKIKCLGGRLWKWSYRIEAGCLGELERDCFFLFFWN